METTTAAAATAESKTNGMIARPGPTSRFVSVLMECSVACGPIMATLAGPFGVAELAGRLVSRNRRWVTPASDPVHRGRQLQRPHVGCWRGHGSDQHVPLLAFPGEPTPDALAPVLDGDTAPRSTEGVGTTVDRIGQQSVNRAVDGGSSAESVGRTEGW